MFALKEFVRFFKKVIQKILLIELKLFKRNSRLGKWLLCETFCILKAILKH